MSLNLLLYFVLFLYFDTEKYYNKLSVIVNTLIIPSKSELALLKKIVLNCIVNYNKLSAEY